MCFVVWEDIKGNIESYMSFRVHGNKCEHPMFMFQGNGSCYLLQLVYAADWYTAKTCREQLGGHLIVVWFQEGCNLPGEILESGGVGEGM